ncbi:hypothetical protein HOLleu_34476 [Holothuria leucospilota]|uniref:arylamine N-acetyltransferase n=1 Tax=Holothuria leucospilota TaxID=206669 RepID=A0A9Q1BH61_HOLLE|nr:hypothetical protein HOLleu_34476 [Holothuria leucospilota]
MSGQGGTCFWINPFTKALLEQLGHTTYLISGKAIPVMDIKQIPTHISTIICDVSYPGSRHLVDPGIGWPLIEAVPLDIERESPEYKVHKLRTKFFKREDGNLVLGIPSSTQVPGSQVISDSNGESWQLKIAYWLNDRISGSTSVGLWQDFAKHGSSFPKPFDRLLFFTFLNEKKISIVSSDGKTHATFYNLKDHTTERITMTKKELTNFFVEHYPQYSVKKLEEVFAVCKLV